jgi:thermostable 8-oxoguanine DNA glycosylase
VFTLQFPAAGIHSLAARYDFADDAAALDAGARIAGGDFGRARLETIFEWKTKGRGRSRLKKNTDEEIADALKLALEAKTPRAAIAVLRGLTGVDVPVASAILATIRPDEHTIIDWRALQAFGAYKANMVIDTKLYLSYLDYCKEIAERNGVSLRDLDRAMWQWSKEQGIPQRDL